MQVNPFFKLVAMPEETGLCPFPMVRCIATVSLSRTAVDAATRSARRRVEVEPFDAPFARPRVRRPFSASSFINREDSKK